MKDKRTRQDWKDHELIIKKYETHIIHQLKKPKTFTCSIKFTNIDGQLIVTGDFCSWVFCRGFEPSPEGEVSDHYWCEKLTIANHNVEYKKYSTDVTRERILDEVPKRFCARFDLSEKTEEFVKNYIENSSHGFPTVEYFCIQQDIEYTSELRDELVYWSECYAYAEDEYEYVTKAKEIPDGDMECAIFGKEIDASLLYVFDAFDEICRRLKERSKEE